MGMTLAKTTKKESKAKSVKKNTVKEDVEAAEVDTTKVDEVELKEEVEVKEEEVKEEEVKPKKVKKVKKEESAEEPAEESLKEESAEEPAEESLKEESAEESESENEVPEEERKVFIKNFGQETTEESLETTLKKYGKIEEIRLPRSRENDGHRGIAYIVFKTKKAADDCVKNLKKIDGEKIFIEKPEKRKTYADSNDENKIFVRNLPFEIDEQKLRQYFEKFGEVKDLRAPMDNGRSKGFCFVEYEDKASTQKALKAKHIFGGRSLETKLASEPREKGGAFEKRDNNRSFDRRDNNRSFDRRDNNRRDNNRSFDRRDNN